MFSLRYDIVTSSTPVLVVLRLASPQAHGMIRKSSSRGSPNNISSYNQGQTWLAVIIWLSAFAQLRKSWIQYVRASTGKLKTLRIVCGLGEGIGLGMLKDFDKLYKLKVIIIVWLGKSKHVQRAFHCT